MANRSFDSVKDLFNSVKDDISEVLSNDVFEEIREVELSHIKSDVYDAYPQRKYKWRTTDGIDDPDNIVIEGGKAKVTGNNIEISVINEALPVNKSEPYDLLDELLEYGTGINTPYGRPRPFVRNTEKEIEENNILEKVLKEELDYIE